MAIGSAIVVLSQSKQPSRKWDRKQQRSEDSSDSTQQHLGTKDLGKPSSCFSLLNLSDEPVVFLGSAGSSCSHVVRAAGQLSAGQLWGRRGGEKPKTQLCCLRFSGWICCQSLLPDFVIYIFVLCSLSKCVIFLITFIMKFIIKSLHVSCMCDACFLNLLPEKMGLSHFEPPWNERHTEKDLNSHQSFSKQSKEILKILQIPTVWIRI